MTGKEVLGIEMEDPRSHLKESIGDYIRDVIDGALCDEMYDKICNKRNLVTEEDMEKYSFYDDPIWKQEWNKKVNEIAKALKL
jgi:hypothetical protein